MKALAIYDYLKRTDQIGSDAVIYLVACNAAGKLGLASRARTIHEDIRTSGVSYENNEKIPHAL